MITKPHNILAICLDCGDTLVDENSEVKNEAGVTLQAKLIPGAAEMLIELKHRGYPLALVADGPADTFRNSLQKQHGLYDLFDVYAISEHVGVEKPHSGIFVHALERLNIRREHYGRTLMVGNNLARDVKGANQLGMISVWLSWSPRRAHIPADEAETPRFSIATPLDLLAILDKLEDDV